MIEYITHDQLLYAIILRADFQKDGIEFFTPPEFSQQLGYMKRPSGYVVDAHSHKQIERTVLRTQEVLFIKSGCVRIDFYAPSQCYLESRTLYAGDTILLAAGGHGLEIIEAAEIIEVKQGPYHSDADKVRFTPQQQDSTAEL